jgi:hypothetical protein
MYDFYVAPGHHQGIFILNWLIWLVSRPGEHPKQ